jgi:hypothetical protein
MQNHKPKSYGLLPLVDDDGLHRIPLRFYAVLLLLLRPYLAWLITLTLPATQRDMLRWVYPVPDDFIRACLIAMPALWLLVVQSQRVLVQPKLRRGRPATFWAWHWRQARWLLTGVIVVDLYWTLTHLPDYVAVQAPALLLAPIALALALVFMLRSRQLPLVFAEWPQPVGPDQAKLP